MSQLLCFGHAPQLALLFAAQGVLPADVGPGWSDPDPAQEVPGLIHAAGGWIENRGQWPEELLFVSQRSGLVARAEHAALAIELHDPARDSGVLVRLCFEGVPESGRGLGDSGWEGTGRREGLHHFYLGADPTNWTRNVREFDQLTYRALYPGVDLVLSNREAGLKYDLLVAPGADLDKVRIRCEGIEALADDGSGEQELATAMGPLMHLPGAAWQVLPSGEIREVTCTWRVVDDNTLGVDCPDRDPDLMLVIDPELRWATYLGSSTYLGTGDRAMAVAVDAGGNAIVTGYTDGHDFPQTPGAFQRPGAGTYNVFVTKLRASDGALMYSSILGGSTGDQRPQDIAVDASGRATIVGWTTAPDYPVTPGAYDTERGMAFWTGFVTQFTAAGDDLSFSSYLEGEQHGAQILAVGYGPQGSVHVGGFTFDPNFPTTPGAFQTTYAGGAGDGVLSRFSLDGSSLTWSTFLGGAGGEGIAALVVDPDGNVSTFGTTISTDFPTTPGSFMPDKPTATSNIAFVTRVSSGGDSLVWSSYLGGTEGAAESDNPRAIGLDALGTVTVLGITSATTFPTTPGAFQEDPPTSAGGGFVTRFRADGSDLIYSTYFGSPLGYAATYDLAVDASGLSTVCGSAADGLPTTPGAYDETSNATDLFVARLDPRGSRLFYASYIGGPNNEVVESLAVSATGGVTVVGQSDAPGGFPTTPGAPFPNFQGGQTDAIVATLDLDLEGAEPYGASTPACLGPLRIAVTEMPVADDPDFALYCSGAPPNAAGWLLISRAPAQPGIGGGSVGVWIDRSQLLQRVAVTSDPFGYVEQDLPLTGGAPGDAFYVQFVFQNPVGCDDAGSLSASGALAITLQ